MPDNDHEVEADSLVRCTCDGELTDTVPYIHETDCPVYRPHAIAAISSERERGDRLSAEVRELRMQRDRLVAALRLFVEANRETAGCSWYELTLPLYVVHDAEALLQEVDHA